MVNMVATGEATVETTVVDMVEVMPVDTEESTVEETGASVEGKALEVQVAEGLGRRDVMVNTAPLAEAVVVS